MLNVITNDTPFLFKSGKKSKQAAEVKLTGAAGNTGHIGSEGQFFINSLGKFLDFQVHSHTK